MRSVALDLGFRIFGPLFTGFLLWLRRAIMHQRPDRVLLFARDAQWVHTLLPRFFAAGTPLPDVRYVHASRAALLLPSMTDFALHRLKHLVSGRLPQSVGSHLARLGLDPSRFASVIRSAGFASADERAVNGDPRMQLLLGKLQDPLLAESLKQRPIVQEYLDQFVDGVTDLLMVDIGWVGNMQSSLVRLLTSRHPRLRFRGYYVGLIAASSENSMPGHPMHGWLTQPGNLPQAERAMWGAGGIELLEFAMRARRTAAHWAISGGRTV